MSDTEEERSKYERFRQRFQPTIVEEGKSLDDIIFRFEMDMTSPTPRIIDHRRSVVDASRLENENEESIVSSLQATTTRLSSHVRTMTTKRGQGRGTVTQSTKRNRVDSIQEEEDIETFNGSADEAMAKDLCFFCSACHCSEEKKRKYGENRIIKCCYTTDEELYHLACCHRIQKNTSTLYLEPKEIRKPLSLSHSQIKEKRKQAMKEEKGESQKNYDEATILTRLTSKEYLSEEKIYLDFKRDVSNGSRKRLSPLRILDLFSGIGSGIVSLKKLGIAIGTVVVSDHDKVANFVNRYNHEEIGECDIKFIHTFEKFEDLRENIDKVVERHGPFDLVMGGPPCQDYTKLNSHAKGVEGSSGKYLLHFSSLITQIQSLQKDHHLFFLCENVFLTGDDGFQTKDLFANIPPVLLDARDFSPCKRKRQFWTNIPFDLLDDTDEDVLMQMESTMTLENGYKMMANFEATDLFVVKANTFLASKSRLDDERMMTVKRENGKLVANTYTIKDRESMMGFPPGYVSIPVYNLFSTLKKEAYKPNWELDEKYIEFGVCEHKSYPPTKDEPFFILKLGEPMNEQRKEPSYFDKEEYAKHLIGNAWSIPVIEHIFKPLQEICTKKTYKNYDYNYEWPPHTLR